MKVIAVTDRRQSVRPFLEQIESVAAAGADMIVLREKDLSPGEYKELALKIGAVCGKFGTEFCINTFSEIAEEIGTGCVWIPFHDLMEKGRPSIRKVGVSVHSESEAETAERKGADFLIYGNVFETACKPGKAAKGVAELGRICSSSKIPVYAIGGISVSNMQTVKDSMADGVCLMSGFMREKDPSVIVKATRNLSDRP